MLSLTWPVPIGLPASSLLGLQHSFTGPASGCISSPLGPNDSLYKAILSLGYLSKCILSLQWLQCSLGLHRPVQRCSSRSARDWGLFSFGWLNTPSTSVSTVLHWSYVYSQLSVAGALPVMKPSSTVPIVEYSCRAAFCTLQWYIICLYNTAVQYLPVQNLRVSHWSK